MHSPLSLSLDFLDHKFYFIAFEYRLKTEDMEFLPAEVGLAEFSLRQGITKTYQKFIKSSKLALGTSFLTCRLRGGFVFLSHVGDTLQGWRQAFEKWGPR